MDEFVFIQQARVAAFFADRLAVANKLVLQIEGRDSRTKSPFQRRLSWDEFVDNYKDKPLFRRHLRMSYESFCILLERIAVVFSTERHIGLDDLANFEQQHNFFLIATASIVSESLRSKESNSS